MLTICTYPVIPVRSAPSECVEMVTQILFGEAYDVLRVDGRWAEILTCDDNYSGWIDYKLIGNLSEDEVNRWLSAKPVVVPPPFLRVRRDDDPALTLLTPGSTIRGAVFGQGLMPTIDSTFTLGGHAYGFDAYTFSECGELIDPVECATMLLGAPYLWGGRTVLGIDCSGLVQTAYKICGTQLPRDASQMIKLGTMVEIEDAQRNDLAFFVNDAGRVCHVGLCMGDGRIIHSSGSVRIDSLDSEGVFNAERNMYTHKLLCIKRVR